MAEAKRIAERLLKTLPDRPQARLLAGRIYYAFNDVTRADECWQACLKSDPEFHEARCAVAEAAWEHGDFEQAAKQLKKVFAANPRLDQKEVFFLADALMNVGDSTGRGSRLGEVGERTPLGSLRPVPARPSLSGIREFDKARQQFEAVLAADPNAINAHFGLATVYTRLGQPEQARTHREQYAKLRQAELAESARLRPSMRKADWADPIPVVRESYLNAGKVYVTHGRADDAERSWLRAAELDPPTPTRGNSWHGSTRTKDGRRPPGCAEV